jgi:hypothetical protein
VLVVGGFYEQRSAPEVEAINFVSRVKIPVLMLNGRFDFFLPEEKTQIPMFQLLGTPAADPTVLGTFLGFFAFDYVWFVFVYWLPGYLRLERHFTPAQMAFHASVPFLAMSVVILLSCWSITQACCTKRLVGTVSGIQNFGGNVAGIIAPWLTGAIAHRTGSFAPAFVLCGFILTAGALAYWLLMNDMVGAPDEA